MLGWNDDLMQQGRTRFRAQRILKTKTDTFFDRSRAMLTVAVGWRTKIMIGRGDGDEEARYNTTVA